MAARCAFFLRCRMFGPLIKRTNAKAEVADKSRGSCGKEHSIDGRFPGVSGDTGASFIDWKSRKF